MMFKLHCAALWVMAGLTAPCGAQAPQTAAEPSAAVMSSKQAALLVKSTNHALERLVILGITTALNPSGTVKLPNGTSMPLGLRREQCEQLKSELSAAASAERYAAAIEVLVRSGSMQRERADAVIRGDAVWRTDARNSHARVAERCAELSVAELPSVP